MTNFVNLFLDVLILLKLCFSNMDQRMNRMHRTQLKFYTNDNENSKSPFNYSLMFDLLISSVNDGVKSSRNADHLSS